MKTPTTELAGSDQNPVTDHERSRAIGRIARLAARLRRAVPQPAVGCIMAALGLGGLVVLWRTALAASGVRLHGGVAALDPANIALAIILTAAIILAQLYPIHVSRGFKISMVTVPLYLLTVLTPPPLAATGAAIALLIGEIAQYSVKGQYPSDIATAVGRWTILVLIAGRVAHMAMPPVHPVTILGMVALPLAAPLTRLPLLLAAGILFCGDMLTVALEIGPVVGEAPHRVVRMVLREGSMPEAVQYLAGLLGALAAMDDAWAIVLLAVPALLMRRLLKYTMEMHDQTRTLLESMADAVDLRDPYTGGHSRRVTAYSEAILRALEISGPEVSLIMAAARVHDIGKIAIPDSILNKPDRLTDEERAVMESHPQRGADFLARYADFRRGISIVLSHHERIDGKGYPQGLHGEDIPFGARVIAVADGFDAMTSDRPYRKGMPHQKAASILTDGRGTQWDSAIVDAFVTQVVPTLQRPEEPEATPPDAGTERAA